MNNKEKMLRISIGKKIKLARTKASFTQEQLAEKLSLSPRYISQLERGIAFGSATTITNICKTLNSFLLLATIPLISFLISGTKFLENYLKLTDYNKLIANSIINELVKIQNNPKYLENE